MTDKDPRTIYAWQRLSEVVTTSGRLEESNVQQLAGLGVKHVIDLAPPEHEVALADEKVKLERIGIAHTQISVPFNRPTEDHYREFVAAYEGGPIPVHVHCIYNYRVSAFFYRYHIEHGMPEPAARALMIPHWAPDASDHPAARPWKEFIDAARKRLGRRTANG